MLKRLRESRGISQKTMAKELNMSQSTYSRIEKGRIPKAVKRLLIISRMVDICPFFLTACIIDCVLGKKVTNLSFGIEKGEACVDCMHRLTSCPCDRKDLSKFGIKEGNEVAKHKNSIYKKKKR